MSNVNIDPTTVATVWHSMQTICKEMRHMVKRTAQNFHRMPINEPDNIDIVAIYNGLGILIQDWTGCLDHTHLTELS